MIKNIEVPNVDIPLLRIQRDHLITRLISTEYRVELEGIINLLDAMLDIAEGIR